MAAQQMLWTVLLVSACLVLTASAEEAGKDPASTASSNSRRAPEDYYEEPYKHEHFYDRRWDSQYCPPCKCEPQPPQFPPPKICLSPATTPPDAPGTVVSARYRLANSGWEMAIAPRGNPINTGVKRFQVDITNDGNTALNDVEFDFELAYNPLSGYIWTLQRSSAPFAGTYTTQWRPADGCFGTPLACTNTPVYGLQLSVQAFNPSTVIDNTIKMTVRDLSFDAQSIQGVTICGSLPTAELTATVGTVKTRWILSDSDLSKISWVLRGKVKGIKNIDGNQEGIRFDIIAVPKSALGESADVACAEQSCKP